MVIKIEAGRIMILIKRQTGSTNAVYKVDEQNTQGNVPEFGFLISRKAKDEAGEKGK